MGTPPFFALASSLRLKQMRLLVSVSNRGELGRHSLVSQPQGAYGLRGKLGRGESLGETINGLIGGLAEIIGTAKIDGFKEHGFAHWGGLFFCTKHTEISVGGK